MADATESNKNPTAGIAQDALLRRILDVVSMPASRIPPQDRQMAGDILLDMLFHVGERERMLCSVRLAGSREAPRRLLRYLAQSSIQVARPLLEESDAFDDCDLADIIRLTTPEHRMAVARRRNLSEAVTAVMVDVAEPHVVREILANRVDQFGVSEPVIQTVGTSRIIIQLWSGQKEQYQWHGAPTFEDGTRAAYYCLSFLKAGDTGPQCSDSFDPAAANAGRKGG